MYLIHRLMDGRVLLQSVMVKKQHATMVVLPEQPKLFVSKHAINTTSAIRQAVRLVAFE
ncbi:hypothetical protein HMPREF1544_01886 [Mucor circinelloides 1006PhL]|uniref:Uncharacterized protein n=1 Tax=Mucor circinelloides f. circinelloides (strain 1006PhL) TaxID=1220926 RepID=S2K7K0_MUCC1|nr:hypothetical protein HMPREF1544_01886 [Mucor circinelloides 1006PhL]